MTLNILIWEQFSRPVERPFRDDGIDSVHCQDGHGYVEEPLLPFGARVPEARDHTAANACDHIL